MKESEARRVLKQQGWRRVRFGKGRHEIWVLGESTETTRQTITLTSKKRGRSVHRNLRAKLIKLQRNNPDV